MNQIREKLAYEVALAKGALTTAVAALEDFDQAPENNVFASLAEARATLEEALFARAHRDCEGSHSCGDAEYVQGFLCDGKVYEALLKVEYNRHDKTYYYVDGSEFSITQVKAE